MRQMQPVLWTKGVLLSPQHLQTQDRFLEELLRFQLAALTPAPWGFGRLDVDREALASGSLVVSATGILPDGMMFDFPGTDAAPLPTPLAEYWSPDRTSLDVYLAVPEYRDGGHNVAVGAATTPGGGAGASTRFVAEVLLRRDENTGLAEQPVQVARKNLRLLAEGDALEGSVTLRVARVRRTTAGEFELDARFVPPLVDIAASPYLVALLRRIVEMLAARSTALAGTRRQRNQSLADFSVTDVASFWLLHTVNTHFPVLRHLAESPSTHPVAVYEAMAALAGALTTFSARLHPRDIPHYEHADPSPSFSELDAMLRELLETVVPANCVALPLRQLAQSPTVHAVALDEDRFLAGQLYLAVSAQLPPQDLVERAPSALKVASGADVERLIRQALPGLPLTHVPTPPSAVPVKLGHHYFRLDTSGSGWHAVRQARNLAVHVPEDFPTPQLELVIVLPPQ